MSPPASPDDDTAPSYHVVLIGIDFYSGVRPLEGCVNDIDAIQDVLLRRLNVPKDRINRLAAPLNDGTPRPTEVPTKAPTLANLIAALTELGNKVKSGDRVFIYYSGHGTQRYVSSQDNVRYYREALVPMDRTVFDEERQVEKEQLLFDWELNLLLGKIAEQTPAVTVVLDCCSSAGATRDVPEPGARARFVPSSEPFVLPPEIAPPPPAAGERGIAFGLAFRAVDVMVVAACLDHELARESLGKRGSDGSGGAAPGPQPRTHGELTRALLGELEAVGDAELSDLRWGRIWRAVVAKVEALHPHQHPWLSSNPARRVFGGPPEQGDLGYAVTFDAARAIYRIDAGSLVGVTEGAVVALYPPMAPPATTAAFPPLNTKEDLDARIGLVRVTSSDRATSVATADPAKPPPSPLATGVRGRLIVAGEAAKLVVALAPHDEAMAGRLASSPLLQIARAGDKGQITLVQRSDRSWAITDDIYGTGEEPPPPVPTLPFLPAAAPAAGAPDIAVNLVEHYYRYAAPLRMARHCTDLPHCLRMKLLDCNSLTQPLPPEQAQDPPLPELQPDRWPNYQLKAGRYDDVNKEWITEGDFYCIRVENTSDVDLWLTLFNCDSDGRVSVYASRASIKKRSRATFWSTSGILGDPIGATLSENQSLGVDRYVAIATTNERVSLDHLKLDTTFAQVARGVGERLGKSRGAPELWTSAVVVVRMAAK